MAYFTAQSTDPAEHCVGMVATADVYVGIIGCRYGSPARRYPKFSHLELEFNVASAVGLPRLVFLLPEDSLGPRGRLPNEARSKQAAFRRRLQDAGLTTARVASPATLEAKLYQALVELRTKGEAVSTDFLRLALLLSTRSHRDRLTLLS
jgi:hypothetical protein